ncbi:hypothetical protein FPOA_12850 [Fusarium poae]|uniref:Uncharacterized protein n=1 Tax=Fusarium poae TaxID=36050 RepID=A0A1B8A7T1_FUSPO|nr:hypothetical protein FPOA_12850 [Fusarium poae]
MPGEATCPPQEDGVHGTATEKDNTAELSPYASRICAVHCQSHEVFYVSSALLRQSPVLASHYNRSLCSSDRNGLVWSGMGGQTKPYQMLT